RASVRSFLYEVCAAIDVHSSFNSLISETRVKVVKPDRHVVERVFNDVPFDTRIGRPPIHADIRVTSGRAALVGDELCGDRPTLLMGHRRVPGASPLVTKAAEVTSGLVPDGRERRNVVARQLALSGVRPDLPSQVTISARAIA